MPSKYPVLTSKEITKGLISLGFVFKSQKGSHAKYVKTTKTVIVPMHKEVAKGTLQSILEQGDIELSLFLKAVYN
jgi:predicted RNA binding protein YcfA (HicA-like mRNA interferase family)